MQIVDEFFDCFVTAFGIHISILNARKNIIFSNAKLFNRWVNGQVGRYTGR
jgi:hypothetical protein